MALHDSRTCLDCRSVAPCAALAAVPARLTPDGYLRVPRDDGELVRLRTASVETAILEGHMSPLAFTCDGCPVAPTCVFAFDLYNTDGDCLDDK